MTMRLDCPVDGCHATIEADTEEEILTQAQGHAASSHPDVELDEEMVETIRSNIREVS